MSLQQGSLMATLFIGQNSAGRWSKTMQKTKYWIKPLEIIKQFQHCCFDGKERLKSPPSGFTEQVQFGGRNEDHYAEVGSSKHSKHTEIWRKLIECIESTHHFGYLEICPGGTTCLFYEHQKQLQTRALFSRKLIAKHLPVYRRVEIRWERVQRREGEAGSTKNVLQSF